MLQAANKPMNSHEKRNRQQAAAPPPPTASWPGTGRTVFSRRVVGHQVERVETASFASELIKDAVAGNKQYPSVLHAGKTFFKGHEKAMEQLNHYYLEPSLTGRLLAAERILDQLPAEERHKKAAEIMNKLLDWEPPPEKTTLENPEESAEAKPGQEPTPEAPPNNPTKTKPTRTPLQGPPDKKDAHRRPADRQDGLPQSLHKHHPHFRFFPSDGAEDPVRRPRYLCGRGVSVLRSRRRFLRAGTTRAIPAKASFRRRCRCGFPGGACHHRWRCRSSACRQVVSHFPRADSRRYVNLYSAYLIR